MNLLLPFAAAAGLLIVFNSKKTSTSSRSSSNTGKKPYPEAPVTPSDEDYEDFPDTVNKEQNVKNAEKYFSDKQYYLTEIPSIYSDLAPELQKIYDPKQTPAYSKSYVYINPEFAADVWEEAKFVAGNGIMQDGKIIKPTSRSLADPFTKVILQKLAPDIYWAEGMIPYTYQSPFYYIWSSVNYLTRIAWADTLASQGNTLGVAFPKSIED